ncbi:MAG: hypothetical protein ABSG68_25115, partial [Thermoguttaceae bacterium]
MNAMLYCERLILRHRVRGQVSSVSRITAGGTTMLIGSIVLATCLWSGTALGAAWTETAVAAIGAAGMGQTDASTAAPADRRAQADDLLRRARQAMAQNDAATAEQLVSQCETLGVQYSGFSMADSPAKIRRDLQRMREAGGASPARPSQLFSPFGSSAKKDPPSDPFAVRSGGNVNTLEPGAAAPPPSETPATLPQPAGVSGPAGAA